MAAIIYVYPQKMRLELITETIDFEVRIGIDEVIIVAKELKSEKYTKIMQPFFKCL